jgi:hypothetical protein
MHVHRETPWAQGPDLLKSLPDNCRLHTFNIQELLPGFSGVESITQTVRPLSPTRKQDSRPFYGRFVRYMPTEKT